MEEGHPIYDAYPSIPLQVREFDFATGTDVYLVRHGESMTNTYANLVAYDPNLTALGWAQALKVAAWMADQAPVDVVITSALRRAHSTALAIGHAQGITPIVVPGLEEFSQGFWQELPSHHPIQPWLGRTDWEPNPVDHPAYHAFRERIHRSLAQILDTYQGQRLCIVSHGGTMGVLLAAFMGTLHASPWTPNTGISRFVWPEWGRWLIFYVNKDEHLNDLDPADYPRVEGAWQDEDGRWHLPDHMTPSWSRLPAHPKLAYLSNKLSRSDRILFIQPEDPITPLRVAMRSRGATILSDNLQLLEAGEVRRALINANHIRYEYLFNQLSYPDDSFDIAVIPESLEDRADLHRVLSDPRQIVHWPESDLPLSEPPADSQPEAQP